MSEIEDLQEQRKAAWKNVKRSADALKRIRGLYAMIESRYQHDEKVYEAIDRKLAMLDGRYQLALAKEARSKQPTEKPLTRSQILSIAEKLGIDVSTLQIEEVEE